MTVLANPFLLRPSARWLIELGPTPERISTEELYPPLANPLLTYPSPFPFPQGVNFKRGLSGEPAISFGLPDAISGIQRIDAVQFTLENHDGRYSYLYTNESRGFTVILHAYDKNTDELQAAIFRGVLATRQLGRHLIVIGATSLNAAMLVDKLPRRTITHAVFPLAFDMNAVIARGIGVAERIPGRYAKRRIAPGDSDHYDYVFATGNVGIDRVYEGSVPAELMEGDTPGSPPTFPFTRLTGEYLVDGEYVTAIRFPTAQASRPSTGDLKPITANVQRVYPDRTADTLLDLKWKGDFFDDARPFVDGVPVAAVGFGSGCPTVLTPGSSGGGSTSLTFAGGASVAFDAVQLGGGGAGGGGAGGGGSGG